MLLVLCGCALLMCLLCYSVYAAVVVAVLHSAHACAVPEELEVNKEEGKEMPACSTCQNSAWHGACGTSVYALLIWLLCYTAVCVCAVPQELEANMVQEGKEMCTLCICAADVLAVLHCCVCLCSA
jgi:hypothetical protein